MQHRIEQPDNDDVLNIDDFNEEDDIDDDMVDDRIGEENPDYGHELNEDDIDEDADRLQAEETVLNNHLECVKQEAYLITVEGEIITKLENAMMNDEQYDMASYLESAEEIARKKLAMYSELLNNISNFKNDFMQGKEDGVGIHNTAAADVQVPREFIKLPSANKRNTS